MMGFYFVGQEDNDGFLDEINHYLDRVILPMAKDIGLKYFQVSGTTERWEEQIQNIFQYKELGGWSQQLYKWNESSKLPQQKTSSTYQIQQVDEEAKLAERLGFKKAEDYTCFEFEIKREMEAKK